MIAAGMIRLAIAFAAAMFAAAVSRRKRKGQPVVFRPTGQNRQGSFLGIFIVTPRKLAGVSGLARGVPLTPEGLFKLSDF
jgi:hypothetical protein